MYTMHKLPANKLNEFKVGIVYLFGSTVQRLDLKLSDVDIGIVFTPLKKVHPVRNKLLTEQADKIGVKIKKVGADGLKALSSYTPLTEFIDPEILKDPLNIYNQLYNIFYKALEPKKEIDLVFLQQTSLNLQFNVINEGKILYEISPVFRADYEEKVLNEYLDFEPISDYFDTCLIRRLK